MLHRAILGSFERFIGIVIEHYGGRFPVWLAPTLVVVATVTEAGDDHARTVHAALSANGIRTELDLRNETVNYKIREHTQKKVPVIFVVGSREAEDGTVSLRWRGEKKQEILALDQAVDKLLARSTITT